jgi:hypothetical protein
MLSAQLQEFQPQFPGFRVLLNGRGCQSLFTEMQKAPLILR